MFEVGNNSDNTLSQSQRWSLYLSYATIFFIIFLGILLRDNTINQTSTYINIESGITVSYPQNWLLEEGDTFIFRVRDMSYRGYKTLMQVATRPISSDIQERNLLDQLSLNRSQSLIDYQVLGYSEYILPQDISSISMSYTFVSRDTSPFLEGVSSVVVGLDVLIIQRGQALIVTLRADADIYEDTLEVFQRFLETLEY